MSLGKCSPSHGGYENGQHSFFAGFRQILFEVVAKLPLRFGGGRFAFLIVMAELNQQVIGLDLQRFGVALFACDIPTRVVRPSQRGQSESFTNAIELRLTRVTQLVEQRIGLRLAQRQLPKHAEQLAHLSQRQPHDVPQRCQNRHDFYIKLTRWKHVRPCGNSPLGPRCN